MLLLGPGTLVLGSGTLLIAGFGKSFASLGNNRGSVVLGSVKTEKLAKM